MKSPALLLLTALTGCATLPLPAYRLELTLQVRDERAVCERAWSIVLPRHGIRVAEALTMRGGQFDTERCITVLYQSLDYPEIVSSGVHIRRAGL